MGDVVVRAADGPGVGFQARYAAGRGYFAGCEYVCASHAFAMCGRDAL